MLCRRIRGEWYVRLSHYSGKGTWHIWCETNKPEAAPPPPSRARMLASVSLLHGGFAY